MGLDMFLHRKIYVGANYEHNQVKGVLEISRLGEPLTINLNKVLYIIEDAGSWRKANQIHRWFVDNVQDGEDNCAEYFVSGEQLNDLRELCKDVLEHHDTKYSLDNLPPDEGFFFGSYDIDDWYYEDLERTVKIVDEIQRTDPELSGEYTYQSSW